MFQLIGGSQNNNFIPFLDEKKDYRIFGICLGMQIMNVAAGGSLIQDIPSEIYNKTSFEQITSQAKEYQHKNYEPNISYDKDISNFFIHPVELEKGTMFDKLDVTKRQSMDAQPNPKFNVVSIHHQCLKKLGKGIHIIATSVDEKVPEAVEHEKYKNVFGVQFHPELSMIYDNDKKYKIKPGDKLHTISDDMKDIDIAFHKELWLYFSSLFGK